MKTKKNKAPVVLDEKEKLTKENSKRLIILTVISLLVAAVYFFLTFADILDESIRVIIMIVYMSTLALFVFAYVFYNKGFTQKHMTAEMLPVEWTKEAKETFLNESKIRANKSKWMIYIIFPLIVTLALDSLLLYVVPFFINLFD